MTAGDGRFQLSWHVGPDRYTTELPTRERALGVARQMQKNMPRDVVILDTIAGTVERFTAAELSRRG